MKAECLLRAKIKHHCLRFFNSSLKGNIWLHKAVFSDIRFLQATLCCLSKKNTLYLFLRVLQQCRPRPMNVGKNFKFRERL